MWHQTANVCSIISSENYDRAMPFLSVNKTQDYMIDYDWVALDKQIWEEILDSLSIEIPRQMNEWMNNTTLCSSHFVSVIVTRSYKKTSKYDVNVIDRNSIPTDNMPLEKKKPCS